MQVYRVKVLSGYRITIPREIRSRLGVNIGDEVELKVESGRIILQLTDLPSDPVLEILGIAPGGRLKIEEAEEAVVKELEEKLRRSRG